MIVGYIRLVRSDFDNFLAIFYSVDTFPGGQLDRWMGGWTETMIIELIQPS